MIISGPGATVTGIRRQLEGYTPDIDTAADNDAVFVAVVDITGRGRLGAVFVKIGGTNTGVTLKITIDGVAIFDAAEVFSSTSNSMSYLPLDWGFSTDCKVEMKLSGAQSATYGVVTNVE